MEQCCARKTHLERSLKPTEMNRCENVNGKYCFGVDGLFQFDGKFKVIEVESENDVVYSAKLLTLAHCASFYDAPVVFDEGDGFWYEMEYMLYPVEFSSVVMWCLVNRRNTCLMFYPESFDMCGRCCQK